MMLRIGSKSVCQLAGRPVSLSGCKTGRPEDRQTKQGFTLVELMLSVVILGFGLSVVIRSYMSALSGFETTQNYIGAIRFAKDKIDELTVQSFESNGLLPESKTGQFKNGAREFVWKTEVSEIKTPEYLNKDFVTASVNLDWQEKNTAKNCFIATYLPKKK